MAIHVLLIEDDTDDALFFSDALKELPWETFLYHSMSGQEVLQILNDWKDKDPDIIFLDVNMPAMNGWECLRQIKDISRLQQIPIIMYSTANLYQEGLEPGHVGAAAFYQKSDSFGEMKASLSSLMRSILPHSSKT